MSPAPASRRLAEPIALPDLPATPSRRPFPIAASILPVLGAVVMWRVTGSVFMLWFAALGPVLAVASLFDTARGARRDRRRGGRVLAAACVDARAELARRHDEERALARAAAPDVERVAADDGQTWRRRGDLVVGTGTTASVVSVTGGEGADAEALRSSAAELTGAPVTVPWAEGVCVRGAGPAALAVVRALAVQLILRNPPSVLHLAGRPLGEGWADESPHLAAPVDDPGAVRVAIVRAGEAPLLPVDALIALAGPDEQIPHECAALVEAGPGLTGRLVVDGGDVELELEAVSLAQARALVRPLARRSEARDERLPSGPIPLAEVRSRDAAEHDGDAVAAGLRAVVGLGPHRGGDAPPLAALDLVTDGPHAVVVGTTGAGKSELLTAWILALAAAVPPDALVFLLADFKGGTAFDHLRALPHVTGVLTDLDGAGARRAVEGLRAELRRREREIAAAGARDVSDPRVGLARLVIVVDEFAALLGEHPDLHAVFTDVAARGRALGMHLVLGTQRASGVLRDALVANAPLRIALRVAEASESTQVVGSDAAARIPGDDAHRGVGYVRRSGDAAPRLVRFALGRPDDVRFALRAHAGVAAARGPLLEPLPASWRPHEAETRGAIRFGLSDDPAEQRQVPAELRVGSDRGLLVVGGAGSGKTEAARWIASAARAAGRRVIEVPRDSEGAWDALDAAQADPPDLFVVDDADAVIQRFPAEHARAAGELLEAIVRDAGATATTVVVTAARLTGAVAKLADLLPRRVVLALPTPSDHVAAGADRSSFDAARPPGRAVVDGLETQLARSAVSGAVQAAAAQAPAWIPAAPVTALVARAAARRAVALRAVWGGDVRVVGVAEISPGASVDDLVAQARGPLVIAGDGDEWQRAYPILQRARALGDVVVTADSPGELRTLAGERDLPPFARPRAGRAWLVSGSAAPRRIVLAA
ncbi:FtsK/SpoIIIE domain-containing protein [Microbacterium indicum]|uniref:FtsK/SpoIIIE domain-containing protein n=1 Tax=Microbacterium indicum TaxID=358100 RepID=UPI0003F94466|nr:FtsK/SpoIIIE domain-containing protein [Microbacterium indicum]